MRKFYSGLRAIIRAITKYEFANYEYRKKQETRNFKLKRWGVIVCLFLISYSANATHLAGGQLTYKWISGTTYVFYATFYRDCAGIAAPTSLPFSYVSASCGVNGSATMQLVAGTGQQITFPCGSATTTCNGGTNPGFQEWEYVDTVNIGQRCTDWVFSWISSARNVAITTIVDPGGDNMYIHATLNNVADSSASSPVFSNFPVALLCIGQTFNYNQGSLDPNGDSLSYSFICPEIEPNTCVTYISPYSATNPIASTPPATINSSTGAIIMNPTTVQVGITTVLVNKYHNGVLVGSVIRDMEFITENCGTDVLPTASGVNGSATVYGDTICAADSVCFNILGNEADPSLTMTMAWNSGIPGASFSVTGNGTQNTVGTFCWKPTFVQARSNLYTFTVTVQNNYCPNEGTQIYSYTVYVPPIIVTASSSNVACNGGTGSATAMGSGGISPYTYVWNPTGQTTPTATGLVAGTTYSVTTTDSYGCTNSNTIVLTQPPAIIASISSSTNVSCHGGNNGSATVSASGGTGSLTNHWSNGQNTSTSTNLVAGIYTDTVKDANGCIKLVNDTITQPATLTATISSQQNASCNGELNGIITITVSGGTRPYSYSWSPSVGTDSTVTSLGAGTYTVTVTDNKGCTTTKTATITQPGTLVPLITSLTVNGGNNISCFGSTNGTASVSVTGGSPAYSYLWSPGGATTDTVTGFGAGTISVLVTDTHGCTADTSVTLSQPDSLSATIPSFSSYFGGVNISCDSANDGFINLAVTGGTPGYTFLWSPVGQTTQNLDSLVAGTYSVLVTDTNGCTATQSITLVQPGPLVVSEYSHSNVGCSGEATGGIGLSVSGGTAPYIYSWSPDVSSDSVATGLVAGSYTISVADQNGCAALFTDSISQPSVIYPLITAATVYGGINIACSGDSTGSAWVTVTGGTAPFKYFWSNGATTDTAFGLGAGPISVHVVDTNGCSINAFDTLSQPEPVSAFYNLSMFPGGANVSCYGSSNGSIQLTVGGGTPGYTYLWSPNVSTDSIATGLSAGIQYNILITDTNGCKDSLFFVLTAPDSLVDSLVALTTNGGWDISCNGGSDGSITAFTSGGTSPYYYSWSPNVSTTSFASGLNAGTYIITVSDTNGCSHVDSITLTQPPPLFDTLSARIYIGGINISCYGYNDGHITDSISGGTAPYSFFWNTGDTTQNLNFIPTGTFVVNVTDANGCTVADTINLTQPDSISQNPIISLYGIYNIQCNGGTGCITLNPSGGTPGYSYFWNPTEDSTMMFCDTAGTYNVVVTDTNGCVSNNTYTLTQPDSLVSAYATSHYGSSNVSCNSSLDGTITVSVSGGVLPYTYTWSPNVSTDSVATGLGAGTYIITVTDSNGCSTVTSSTLIAPPLFTDSVSTSVYAGGYNVSCAGNDGSITILPTGGIRPYNYVWSPPVSTDSTASGLSAGLYIIMVTDSNGCSVTDSVTLTQAVVFTITDSLSSYNGYNLSCNGSTNGSIYVILTGGVPPFTFHWNTGDTTQNLINVGAGTYVDTITNAQGCVSIDSTTLVAPSPLSLGVIDSSYNGSGIKCNTDSNGYIQLVVTGGTAPITYTWSPSVSTDSIASNLGAGTYSYTVTDANGCSATGSQTLTAPPPVNLSVIDSSYNGSGIKCNTDSNGYIHLIVTGGTAPITYSWSPSVSTDSIASNLGAGTYSYTVTDANGCSATGSQTLTAPPPVNLSVIDSSYNGSGVKCNADSNGYIHLIVTGGTAPITYTWSPSVSTDSIAINLGAGTYSYTVTDANGCSATGSQTLTAPQPVNLSVIDSSYNGSGVKCNGDSNGYIHLIVTGGTVPITYTWSPSVSTDSIASGLGAGTYSYTVTDANGCSATGSQTLTAPQPVNLSVIDSVYNGSGVKCNGDMDGYIHLIVTGGTPTITYTWSPLVSTDSIASNLGVGTYSYTVTDANGCSATGSQTLTAPQPVNLSVIDSSYNGSGVKCNGDMDGYIHLIVTGGSVPITYVWSPPVSTDSIASGLGAGTYSYTVTDANGCSATGSQTITAPQPVIISVIDSSYNGSGVKCNSDSDGYIHLIVTGGTTPITYVWSPSVSTDSIASGLGAGTYSYTVTDANGCSAAGSQTITAPQPINLSVIDSSYNGSGVKCSGDMDGYIHLIVTGGTTPITYVWSPAVSIDSIASGLGSGTYSYTVTDANGCSATGLQTLTAPLPISDSLSSPIVHGTYNILCNGDSSGTASAIGKGGTGPYTYVWSNGQTSQTATNLSAQTYSVTVTDTNGCSIMGSITLTQPPPIIVNAGQNIQICGDSVILSANAPALGDTGTWSVLSGHGKFSNVNDSNAIVTGLDSGSNVLQWSIAYGVCFATATVTVDAFDSVQAAVGPYDSSLCPVDTSGAKLNAMSVSIGNGFWKSLGSASVIDSLDPTTEVIHLVPDSNNRFVWVVTNGPCTASDTAVIFLKPQDDCFDTLQMPTGFSPNGDGVNDSLIIHGIDMYPNNTFEVFNRWGNKVYSANNYNNTSVVWVGNNNSGEPLPSGTYFAILVIENSKIRIYHYVDLRR